MFARMLRAAVGATMIAVPAMMSAQSTEGFTKGSRVASLGVMLGGDNDGIGLGGMAEVGVLPLGKFTLGVGGMLGFQRDSESALGTKITVTSMPIMAIGNVHFPVASQPRLDLYAGASVGFIRVSADVEGTGSLGGVDASNTDSGFGIQGGARYKLAGGTSVFGQVGFGDIPLIFGGISFKF